MGGRVGGRCEERGLRWWGAPHQGLPLLERAAAVAAEWFLVRTAVSFLTTFIAFKYSVWWSNRTNLSTVPARALRKNGFVKVRTRNLTKKWL